MDFIKNFFSGILSFFSGLFGGKKSEGNFYMQLEESQESSASSSKESSAPKQEKKPEPASTQTKQEKKPEPAQTKQPQPVATATKKEETKEEKTTSTFAPNYLKSVATANQPRRRPGPSLDMFRDMARQVKTPAA